MQLTVRVWMPPPHTTLQDENASVVQYVHRAPGEVPVPASGHRSTQSTMPSPSVSSSGMPQPQIPWVVLSGSPGQMSAVSAGMHAPAWQTEPAPHDVPSRGATGPELVEKVVQKPSVFVHAIWPQVVSAGHDPTTEVPNCGPSAKHQSVGETHFASAAHAPSVPHAVPIGSCRSGGQNVDVPSHCSATSHSDAALLQTAPAAVGAPALQQPSDSEQVQPGSSLQPSADHHGVQHASLAQSAPQSHCSPAWCTPFPQLETSSSRHAVDDVAASQFAKYVKLHDEY